VTPEEVIGPVDGGCTASALAEMLGIDLYPSLGTSGEGLLDRALVGLDRETTAWVRTVDGGLSDAEGDPAQVAILSSLSTKQVMALDDRLVHAPGDENRIGCVVIRDSKAGNISTRSFSTMPSFQTVTVSVKSAAAGPGRSQY